MTKGRAGALFVVLAAGGCGDPTPPTARVEGEIRYSGALQGSLLISTYDSFPPSGEPLAAVEIASPVFPQPYALDLPRWATSVFVLAVLDASPEDGFRYHSLVDAGGAWPELLRPEPFDVSATAGRADITLVDPRAGLPSP